MAKAKKTAGKKTTSKSASKPKASKSAKLLAKTSKLKALLPAGIQYDDVKAINIDISSITGTVSVLVGPKGTDRSEESELTIDVLKEFIGDVAGSEKLKTDYEKDVEGDLHITK